MDFGADPTGLTAGLGSPIASASPSSTVCLRLSSVKVQMGSVFATVLCLFPSHSPKRLLFKNANTHTPTTYTPERLGQKCSHSFSYTLDLRIGNLVRMCCLGYTSGCGKRVLLFVFE